MSKRLHLSQISGKTSLCGYHHMGIDTIEIQIPLYKTNGMVTNHSLDEDARIGIFYIILYHRHLGFT